MPRLARIQDKDGSVYIVVSNYEDVIERNDPAEWFGVYSFFQLTQVAGLPETIARRIAMERVTEFICKPCPGFLLELFNTNKKREQENLLRGHFITPENLICWFLKAGAKKGTFSQYGFDGGAGDLSGRNPVIIDASDPENIKTIGQTDLSQEALRTLVETQHKVLAQIIDFSDGRWYCFYRTHRGLAGRESGKHGQHLHFISSAYGIDRETLVGNFMRGICPSNGFHVNLVGYYDGKER